MRYTCKILRPQLSLDGMCTPLNEMSVILQEWFLYRKLFNSWALLTISEGKAVPVLDVKVYGGLK